MTSADVGFAAALYVTGACLGALFFGGLTDRHDRKKLFTVTLALIAATDLGSAAMGALRAGAPDHGLLHGARRRRVLPRLGRRELRIPDGQRGLRDGDPRAPAIALFYAVATAVGGIAGSRRAMRASAENIVLPVPAATVRRREESIRARSGAARRDADGAVAGRPLARRRRGREGRSRKGRRT